MIKLPKYPYILNTGKLRKFLGRISQVKVPDKVTYKYLSSLGFKSKFDRPIVSILEFINFIDATHVPTQNYRDFRVKSKSKATMASALKSAYSELFGIYANACDLDDSSLKDFFAQHIDAGEQVKDRTVDTFKILCSFADFKAVSVEEDKVAKELKVEVVEKKKEKFMPQIPAGVTINLNIQLTLPATDDATVYDKIFKALKENLLTRD